MNRVYFGVRKEGRTIVTVEKDLKVNILPGATQQSSTGYDWGYNGSAPADLARSILTDAVGTELAGEHYQEFVDIIAGFQKDEWSLSKRQILDWFNKKGVDVGADG